MIADTRQGVRFVAGHWVLDITKRGYDIFRILGSASYDSSYETGGALGSASCDSRYGTGGTIWYGDWVLHFVIIDIRQGKRLSSGIGFFILR